SRLRHDPPSGRQRRRSARSRSASGEGDAALRRRAEKISLEDFSRTLSAANRSVPVRAQIVRRIARAQNQNRAGLILRPRGGGVLYAPPRRRRVDRRIDVEGRRELLQTVAGDLRRGSEARRNRSGI